MNLWLPGGRIRGRDREFGVEMYTLLYLKQINNKDLLHSTWNSVHCCGSLEGRGVWGRMGTCINIYKAESLYRSPESITTLLISYIPTQILKFLHFYGGVLWFSLYNIISTANGDSYAPSFLIWMPFVSFPCLITLGFTIIHNPINIHQSVLISIFTSLVLVF